MPRGALFQTALAVDPAAWEGELGDGVRFLVGVRPEGGNETLLLDATVHPRGRGDSSARLDVAADLRPWAGQRVRLSLRTDPRDDPSVDWSGWAEPVVVRVDDQTADRLLQSTAQLQERVLRPEPRARPSRPAGGAYTGSTGSGRPRGEGALDGLDHGYGGERCPRR